MKELPKTTASTDYLMELEANLTLQKIKGQVAAKIKAEKAKEMKKENDRKDAIRKKYHKRVSKMYARVWSGCQHDFVNILNSSYGSTILCKWCQMPQTENAQRDFLNSETKKVMQLDQDKGFLSHEDY